MEKEREKKLPTRNRNTSFGPFTNLHTTHTHVCLRSLFTHTFTLSNHINISFNSKKTSLPFPRHRRSAIKDWQRGGGRSINFFFFFFFSRPLTMCNLHSMPIYLLGISMCSRTALLMHLLPLRHIR